MQSTEHATPASGFVASGIAGPAVLAGSMLLLNKVAMALFVGLGPIFILSLMFEQTKQLFSKWLFYGIGTMFPLAVLSVMVAIALDMVLAVAGSFRVGKFLGSSTEGVNSMALQQGGLGLVLTTLIVMAPPMAASFFQGMLGQFTAYSAFGGIGRGTGADSAGRTPGMPGYSPASAPAHTGQPPTGQPSGFNNSSPTGAYASSASSSQDVVRRNSQAKRGT
ncbi:type IV secretion system protein [Pseudoxanthomonas wuyuanensis]|uniref:TrbL/VirB6 plasmid conjugal transfer protein n=1 Tax=Pseudoxanthomonas wuyuanensis TaxID=1073196 RepID=A0A286DDR9_9GAMM|nr:TrbL/VirB6 plasmid conjugal transfer protein [Pseudoxanthomonas wuyuanensis]